MNQSEFSNDPKTLKSHMKAYAKKRLSENSRKNG